MSNATFDPFEITFYALSDASSFGLAAAPDKPFRWVKVMLAVIATIVTVTKRHDVSCDSSRTSWVGQSDPMIGGYSVPKPSRTTAYCATMSEVIKTTRPLFFGKSIGQPPFPSRTPMMGSLVFTRIALVMFFVVVGVILAKLLVLRPALFFVGNVIALVSIARPLGVLILRLCTLNAIRIAPVALHDSLASAFATLACKTVSVMPVDMKGKPWQPLMAFGAFTKRHGVVKHRNLLSLHLGVESGPAPRNAVVRRVINPSQAHGNCITSRQVALCH